MGRRLLAALVAVWASPLCVVDAWISISQARFGVQIEDIYNESFGYTQGDPQLSLGYLWSQPATTIETTGLGSSITWQWDERLCEDLKFEENFWAIPLVDCASAKASMHRAFSTWSMNSRHIKFTDVSEPCAVMGYTKTRCPLAEIFVTSIENLNGTSYVVAPTVSSPIPEFTYDFRHTNGQTNRLKYRIPGTNGSFTEAYAKRRVAEVVGGSLAFRTTGECWYIDSEFCSGWHGMKSFWNSPKAGYAVGVSIFFTFWFFLCCAMTCLTTCDIRRTLRKRLIKKYEVDSDFDGKAPSCLEQVCAVIASFSITGAALRIMILIIVWPFYTAIFVNCWSCYDFEAGAAHEVGHLLGLGHPELAGLETVNGFLGKGYNSYHVNLAKERSFNESTCLNPWESVRPGVPEDAVLDPAHPRVKVRPSIMFDFNKDNPRHCLEADDLEALNVLYPDCDGGPTTPICAKPAVNLGWLRVQLAIAVFFVALLFALMLNCYARRMLRRIANPKPQHNIMWWIRGCYACCQRVAACKFRSEKPSKPVPPTAEAFAPAMPGLS